MKALRLSIYLIFLTIPLNAQNVDELLRERVEAGETPGIVVGIYRDGKTAYYAYGLANVAENRKVDSKTLFEIGSITKTFTTTMMAQQAQEGRIKLTDPVQNYLPEKVSIPTRNDKAITFEDLASARSGLPRMPSNFNPANNADPFIDYTEEKLFDFLKDYKLTRDIGSQYEYSNLGMGLLGALVSRIDSKTYREAVETRILKPLGMNSTFINTPGRKDTNSATGYSGSVAVPAWTWSDGSAIQGAGGLLSNAEDMIKYLMANINPPDNSLGKAMQDAHHVRMEMGGPSKMIGLGWHMRVKTIWHNGGTGGFRTFAGFDPERKIAVVVLTNSNTGADDLGFHLIDENIPLKKMRKAISVSTDLLQSYTGTYELNPQFKIEITEEQGALFAQATNQPKFNLYAESEKKFFLKAVDAQIEFVSNDKGEIEKLLLYQNGATRTGVRKR